MRFITKRHTIDSVSNEIIKGLNSGELSLFPTANDISNYENAFPHLLFMKLDAQMVDVASADLYMTVNFAADAEIPMRFGNVWLGLRSVDFYFNAINCRLSTNNMLENRLSGREKLSGVNYLLPSDISPGGLTRLKKLPPKLHLSDEGHNARLTLQSDSGEESLEGHLKEKICDIELSSKDAAIEAKAIFKPEDIIISDFKTIFSVSKSKQSISGALLRRAARNIVTKHQPISTQKLLLKAA